MREEFKYAKGRREMERQACSKKKIASKNGKKILRESTWNSFAKRSNILVGNVH